MALDWIWRKLELQNGQLSFTYGIYRWVERLSSTRLLVDACPMHVGCYYVHDVGAE